MDLSFLDELGESKNEYEDAKLNLSDKMLIEYLDILVERNQMMEDFKSEILNLYLNKKISKKLLFENINNSISAANKIVLKILSLDDSVFKLKNEEYEYIGAIPKLPNSFFDINPNSGKVSYSFAMMLVSKLKERNITLGEIISLSDCLDFKVARIVNWERISE
jgi:hypothetical protein